MKRDNIPFDKIEEAMQGYQQRSIEDLKKIYPKWAYGKFINKILDADLQPKNKDFTFFLANPTEIISNTDFENFHIYPLFTGATNNDFRITRILYRWENDYFVDPPILGKSNLVKSKLLFSDGRHRTKLSYHLGLSKIPVAILTNEILEIGSIIQLSSI